MPGEDKASYVDMHSKGGPPTWPVWQAMSPGSPDTERREQEPGADGELWEAVAEPSRRRVLDLLLIDGEATPTMLATRLPVTRQAVAKHLAVLTRAGLVESHRHGRWPLSIRRLLYSRLFSERAG